MIKIYGSPRSSAGRCYLVLEEIGVPYETVSLDFRQKEHKSPEFLKLNPNGKVPCLVDGDYVIWESAAINYYLADKYKPELLGKDPQVRGLVQQWSTWALVEFQPPLVDMLIQIVFMPPEKRDENLIKKAQAKIPAQLQILNQALSGKSFLVANTLTLADLNVASAANLALSLNISFAEAPHVEQWLTKLRERPSFKKFSEEKH